MFPKLVTPSLLWATWLSLHGKFFSEHRIYVPIWTAYSDNMSKSFELSHPDYFDNGLFYPKPLMVLLDLGGFEE